MESRAFLTKTTGSLTLLDSESHMQTSKLLLIWLFLLLVASASVAQNAATAFVVPIHGEINPARVVFVRRSIDQARDAGADYIIFEIDTFGGRVDSALQITTLIGSATDAITIAYVPASAEGTGVSWSAGALISLACDRIYMGAGTSIGAAAPVFQTQTGMEMAPEKTVSAVRAQMAALAEKNGYPVAVARAMVDQDIELIEVYLGDELILAARDEMTEIERDAENRGVTIEEGKVISATGKLLTLTAGEMEKYGVSSGTVFFTEELYGEIGVPDDGVTILAESAADRAAAFVTGSAVAGLLVLAGLVALYLEITSPGFGVPGTIAIICFAVVFLGSALLGTVGSIELLMFLAGVVLLVVEIFLIPGFGVTGVSGILLIAVSLVLSRQDFVWPEFDWEWDIFRRNIVTVGISVVSSIVVFGILLKAFPRLPLFNRLILAASGGSGATATAVGSAASISSPLHATDSIPVSAGDTGVVVTALRPVGKADLGGEIWEVQSDADFVEPGEKIVVTEVRGKRIEVRRSGVS